MNTYILDKKGGVVLEKDILKWEKWHTANDSQVVKTTWKDGDEVISTIFTGLNINHLTPEPQYFETMVYGSRFNGRVFRYATRDEAIESHRKLVKLINKDKE